MVDRDVIARMPEWFVRGVYLGRVAAERRQATYVARVTGQRAIRMMWALRPYMGQRRQAQIDIALASFNERRKSPTGRVQSKCKAASS